MRAETTKISVRICSSKLELLRAEYRTDSNTEIIQALIDEKLDKKYHHRGVVRPVFSSIGGKQKVADRILEYIPTHRIYSEPFGNTAAVLIKKKPAALEVYNDISSEVVNFHEVLRDNPAALIECCGYMPYSEKLYADLKNAEGGSKVERAARYFYLARCGYLGTASGQLNNAYKGQNDGKWKNASISYYRAVDRLWTLAKRFRGVEITCRDYKFVINRFKEDYDAFFLLDAPYLKYDKYYEGAFGWDEYLKMSELLSGIKGKYMVCHSYDKRVDELFMATPNARREVIRTTNFPAKPEGGKRKQSYLYLYMNY